MNFQARKFFRSFHFHVDNDQKRLLRLERPGKFMEW